MNAYQTADFILVSIRTVRHGQSFKLEEVKDKAFSEFWLSYGSPGSNKDQELAGSAALVPPLFQSAAGTVLHVGPGSGTQVSYFASNSKVDRIYGAEPAIGLHDQLAAEIRVAKLDDKYFILPCKADTADITKALKDRGINLTAEGHFDSIICVRTLCSMPDPDSVIRELYHLLKPQGQLLVLEHVKNPWQSKEGSLVARLLQSFYMLLGWRFFVGGCCLDRDLEQSLRRVGESEGRWEEMKLESHFAWNVLPYLKGELRKR